MAAYIAFDIDIVGGYIEMGGLWRCVCHCFLKFKCNVDVGQTEQALRYILFKDILTSFITCQL